MEELIERVSAATGLEPDTAHKAVGMVLNFVQKQLPPEQSAALFDKLPGAREAAAGAAADDPEGGSSLMELANQLMTTGLGMGDMQTLGREMFAYLRQQIGEDAVGELGAAIPGLQQFM
jgi:hypothetical protein